MSKYGTVFGRFGLAQRKKTSGFSKKKIPRHYSVESGVSDETIKAKTSMPLTNI